jgi:indole-3-glycerol phosphate synthase
MTNKLEAVVAQKQLEVAELYNAIAQNTHGDAIKKILCGEFQVKKNNVFKRALSSSSLAVIAEIKRKSPSKGTIAPIIDPAVLAQRYIAGGASALSILTDKYFFDGNIQDIIRVKEIITHSVPIIRKDFIIDKVQIAEALAAGASAILCIVAVLGAKTKQLLDYARSLGLDVLVEIHNENELDVALESGADIIGINNRNLSTFIVDPERSLQLVDKIPASIIKVAESGITTPAMAKKYHQAGFNAVLIGEALVRSSCPEQFIMGCRNA